MTDTAVAKPPVCKLCGHEITFAKCGFASANGFRLCHHDTHSCFNRWTVYGERPDEGDIRARAEWLIAAYLDMPSVYMGGPTPPSRRKAKDIIDRLIAAGFQITKDDPDDTWLD